MYSPLFVTLMGIGTVFFGLVCAPAVNTAKEQEILAAVIAAVTEDLGPSASRMQITSINKI